MNQACLESLKTFFDEFTQRHFGDDAYVNANLQLKVDHSLKVAAESRNLAERLRLPAEQVATAEALGLLHDIGRFPQFIRYHTYFDARSEDHSRLGIHVLHHEGLWRRLEPADRTVIAAAIRWHGSRVLPEHLAGNRLLMARLIRDADKLDIYRVVLAGYAWMRRDPEHFPFEREYPELPGYSPDILRRVVNGERILYDMMTCMNDSRLLKVSWVYDINYRPTLEQILERRYLETLFEYLPRDEAIDAFRRDIFTYLHHRIRQG